MSTPTETMPGGARAVAGFMQAILDTAGEAIVSLDRTGVIRSFNRSAERMFGWSACEVIGQHVGRLMPRPEDCRSDDHLTPYLLVGGGPSFGRARQVVGLRRDGTRFPMDLSVSQFDADDGPQFTWILRDVAEQAHLREQLRQSQKMDAMGRLAGGVAHDFNNLLTVINGWCEGLSAAAPEERTAAVEQIVGAAAKAANLAGQLLSFSRQNAVTPRVVDLNLVIDDIGRMLRRAIGEDIRLESVPSPTPVFVRVDQGQMDQVLVNLALNARDAMPRGGRLTLGTERRLIDAADAATLGVEPGAYVALWVRDTGTGIPCAALPRIFEPFFTTKADRGTGLGLATVQTIVHCAGGVIAATNVPEGGAEFKILLPEAPPVLEERRAAAAAVRAVPAPRVAQPASQTEGGGETVLVVEDDAQVRRITVSMLKNRGYDVLEAATCQEALSLVTTHTDIDVLVTDVVMPDLSGPELAARIRTVHPTIRVLLVSGYSAEAVARHGVDGSAPCFLQKPFNGNQLAKKVQELLATRPPATDGSDFSAVVLQ
jgi:two-component system cell cycle sensor histidine kinase/response regulator CckA